MQNIFFFMALDTQTNTQVHDHDSLLEKFYYALADLKAIVNDEIKSNKKIRIFLNELR